MDYVHLYLISINIISFIIYGLDKILAIFNKSRIRESTLLFFSIIGGVFGAMLAMFIFHHKIRKKKFIIINTMMFIIVSYIIWRYLWV